MNYENEIKQLREEIAALKAQIKGLPNEIKRRELLEQIEVSRYMAIKRANGVQQVNDMNEVYDGLLSLMSLLENCK